MGTKVCEKCGGELLIKEVLTDSYEYWCPPCLGLTPLAEEESIRLCKEYLRRVRGNCLERCSKFSKDSLLYASLNLREMAIDKQPDVIRNTPTHIIFASLILKDCLKGTFNPGKEAVNQEALNELFKWYHEQISADNLLVELEEKHFLLFEESEKLKEMFPSKKIDCVVSGKNYFAFPKYSWHYFLDALETVQVGTSANTEKIKKEVRRKADEHKNKIAKQKLKILSCSRPGLKSRYQKELAELEETYRIEALEMIYVSLSAFYFNKDFFLFKELKRESFVSRFIAQVIKKTEENLKKSGGGERYYR